MYQKNIIKKMISKYSNCNKNKIIEERFVLSKGETFWWGIIFEGYEDIASFTTEKKISQTEILVKISYPDFFSLMIKNIIKDLKRWAYE